jgi:plastocyanin
MERRLMKRNTLIGIIVAAVLIIGVGALVLANSSGNDSSTTAPPANTTTKSSQQSSSDESTATTSDSVVIDNFAFSPASITVKKGTTVTWTNKDSATHTVTENDGQNGPDSGDLAQGKAYSFTFDTVGTFKYHCTIHTAMTGTVTVTQ